MTRNTIPPRNGSHGGNASIASLVRTLTAAESASQASERRAGLRAGAVPRFCAPAQSAAAQRNHLHPQRGLGGGVGDLGHATYGGAEQGRGAGARGAALGGGPAKNCLQTVAKNCLLRANARPLRRLGLEPADSGRATCGAALGGVGGGAEALQLRGGGGWRDELDGLDLRVPAGANDAPAQTPFGQ